MQIHSQPSKIQTDETLMEVVDRGSRDYPFYYYYEDMTKFCFNCVDWHWHDEFEIVYVEEGAVTFYVGAGEITLEAGEAILINSKTLHRLYAREHGIIPNFLFPPDFFAPQESRIYRQYVLPFLTGAFSQQVFSREIPWQRDVLHLICEIIRTQTLKSNRELRTSALLLQLWAVFWEHTSPAMSNGVTTRDTVCQARLQLMLQYIQTNYASPITLDSIASSAQIGKSSALELFRRYLHISPVKYLISYRLKKAAGLLRGTALSVSAIAESCGFDHVGYFCRAFKEAYQQTPTQYRNAQLGRK